MRYVSDRNNFLRGTEEREGREVGAIGPRGMERRTVPSIARIPSSRPSPNLAVEVGSEVNDPPYATIPS